MSWKNPYGEPLGPEPTVADFSNFGKRSAQQPIAPSTMPSAKPSIDYVWWIIGAIGLVGLIWWPALVIAGCWGLSKYRGPDHHTKFMVPYAYRFRWDPGWICIVGALALGALGLVNNSGWLLGLAIFAGLMRVVIWLCFRFPLMSWFFIMFIVFLFGIGIRRGLVSPFF